VAFLSGGGDWTTPFVAGAGCAMVSALIWLLINPAAPAHASAERAKNPIGNESA
jgi:hypothetical protein